MSDYLGPNQSRVLETENRSWESVVYQWRKPPLSSEYNLSGLVPAEQNKQAMKSVMASGWSVIGYLREEGSLANSFAGDIITSHSFNANTFQLVAQDQNVETKRLTAWVNGWEILVQGSNSTNENNLITLPDPPSMGNRVD